MGFLREPSHLIFVGLIIIVLFGSRKLPDAARGIGQAMRIFKTEVKAMQNEDAPRRPTAEPVEPPLEGKVVPPQAPRVSDPVRETPRNL
jgi:sec-independent protein translocase protein TatA